MNSNLFYRSNPLRIRSDGGTVQLSFSSEQPVSRWFGTEILLHNPGNVDLTRLQAVGSLIYGHDSGKIENILGRIDRVWLEDRRGHAEIKMDTDPAGQAALVKIKSGSIRGISVGYLIDQAQRIEEGETWSDPDSGQRFKGPAMVATRWTPYEISLTPIPADPSVGIGRDLTRSLDGIHITTSTTTRKEIATMDKQQIREMVQTEYNQMITSKVKDAVLEVANLRDHAKIISPEAAAMVEESLKRKIPIEEIQRRLLDLAGIVSGATINSNQPQRITSFRQITDEEFIEALKDPAAHAMDSADSNRGTTVRSFKQITDDEFINALKDPGKYAVNR